MIFYKNNSILNQNLKKYESLFKDWDKDSFNDGSIDEIAFRKGDVKIVFQEDLREHITNFSVLHPQKRIVKIDYREVVVNNELSGIDELKEKLWLLQNKNNVEDYEVEIYVEFLKHNNLI